MRAHAGFTLIEVVLAMFLISVGLIATAPLFVLAARQNTVGQKLGSAGAAAVRRMELLRAAPYASLAVGGNLAGNVGGYFDASDPEVLVRWTVATNPNPPAATKVVTVRAIAVGPSLGRGKDALLITVRGD